MSKNDHNGLCTIWQDRIGDCGRNPSTIVGGSQDRRASVAPGMTMVPGRFCKEPQTSIDSRSVIFLRCSAAVEDSISLSLRLQVVFRTATIINANTTLTLPPVTNLSCCFHMHNHLVVIILYRPLVSNFEEISDKVRFKYRSKGKDQAIARYALSMASTNYNLDKNIERAATGSFCLPTSVLGNDVDAE